MRDALTPMMQQYRRLRGSIPADTLLLFRLGDFYELFFEDAKEASVLLNVALTKRNGVPMCGMPYHAAQTYIAKLIKAGRRVAICDQTSEPQPGKIVSRDITQIISAGTVSDFDLLEAKRANYLGAIYADGGIFGFAYADLTTGEFRLTELQDRQSLLDELARVSPSELLVSAEQKDQLGQVDHALEYDSYAFLPEQAIFTLCEHFKVKSLDGFGCGEMSRAVAAAGAIVHYLKHQLRRNIDHLTSLRCDAPADYVMLDAATQTNLELVESRGTRDTTLLGVLDRTITPMGGRRLRSWILQPLRNLHELERRQQMISDLLQEPDLLAAIRAQLKSIRDIERATSRLSQASGNARDLVALKFSLQEIPKLKCELQKLIDRTNFGRAGSPSPPNVAQESGGAPNASPARTGRALPIQLQNEIHEMPALAEKLGRAVVDDPPLVLKDGGIFRDGYDADLDELRRASHEGKKWISHLQEREIAEKIESRECARALHAQADYRGGRALRHARAKGDGGENPRCRRTRAPTRVSAFPKTARRNSARAGVNPANCRCHSNARRHLRVRRDGAVVPFLSAALKQYLAAYDQGWTASGTRPESGGRKICA